MRRLFVRLKKSNKRFWQQIEVPDLLYCAVVVGIVILSAVVMILFAPLRTPFGAEETNLSNSTDQSDTAIKDEIQPQDTTSRDTTVSVDPTFKVELRGISDKLGKIEQQYLSNELRKEILDTREESIDWWMGLITVVLGFFALVVTIFGFVSFRQFRRIMDEARENLRKTEDSLATVQKGQEIFNQSIQNTRDRLDAELIPKVSHNSEFWEILRAFEQSRNLPVVDKAMVDACKLQRNGKIKDAIQKWRFVADTEEIMDSNLAARAWKSIGYLYLEENNLERAFSAYSEAIRLNSNDAIAYFRRGDVQVRREKYKPAITDYDRAIVLRPNSAEAYLYRANAKFELRKYNDTIADCNIAINWDQYFTSAYALLAEAKIELGQDDEGKTDLEKALELAVQQGQMDLKPKIELRLQNLNESDR